MVEICFWVVHYAITIFTLYLLLKDHFECRLKKRYADLLSSVSYLQNTFESTGYDINKIHSLEAWIENIDARVESIDARLYRKFGAVDFEIDECRRVIDECIKAIEECRKWNDFHFSPQPVIA